MIIAAQERTHAAPSPLLATTISSYYISSLFFHKVANKFGSHGFLGGRGVAYFLNTVMYLGLQVAVNSSCQISPPTVRPTCYMMSLLIAIFVLFPKMFLTFSAPPFSKLNAVFFSISITRDLITRERESRIN